MKRLIILLLITTCSVSIFATPITKTIPDPVAKIQKVFHRDFPDVTNESMRKVGDFFIISFKNEDQSLCRIYYDANGNTLQTIRNYKEDKLEPFIRAKIKAKYKDMNIFMVTDVAVENEHYYEIMLQNNKSLWIVHAKDDGTMFVEKKYKNAD